MQGWLLAATSDSIAAGSLLVLAVITTIFLVAALDWELTPRARRLLDHIQEALERRGQLKMAAADLAVRPERISRWLRPTQPNILTRLADLGDDFERDVIAMRAAELGIVVVDARLAAALDLIDAHRERMRAHLKETA